jgi:hypothetical protein
MTTDVIAFDQSAFRKRVADHINDTFAALIPPEQFQAMVDAQVKEFFETPRAFDVRDVQSWDTDRWGNRQNIVTRKQLSAPITPFQQMVWSVLHEIVGSKLAEYMKDKDRCALDKFVAEMFELKQFGDQQIATAEKLMIAMAASMFTSLITSATEQTKQGMANAAQRANMPELATNIWQMPVY